MDIGKKILKIRNDNDLSQSQFAEKLSVTRQTVSNWENNKNYPDMDTLRRISDIFGVSFDELLKEDSSLMEEIDKNRKWAVAGRRSLPLLIIAIGILLAAVAIPRIVPLLYYNPLEKVFEEKEEDGAGGEFISSATRLDADMRVYSELFLPCRRLEATSIRNLGMGNYDIKIGQSTWVSGTIPMESAGSIERNHMRIYDASVIEEPVSNCFEWPAQDYKGSSLEDNYKKIRERAERDLKDDEEIIEVHYGMTGNPENSMALLKNLEEGKYYLAYINLNKITGYDEALKWMENYEDSMYSVWAGIKTSDEFEDSKMGMQTIYTGSYVPFDTGKYPLLFGYDYNEINNPDIHDLHPDMRKEENAGQHFTSMLKYMGEQKTFLKMIKPGEWDYDYMDPKEYFNKKIAYINKNGMKVYGFAVIAEKSELIKMLNDKAVYTIATEKLK